MYRDVAPDLDEHDHAIGAILIGESLIAGCERAAARLRDPKLAEPWLVVGDAQLFAEVWRHLDRAKRALASRGANTAGYDELRPRAKTTVIEQRPDGNPRIDTAALDDARRAVEELKLVVPGADWAAIEKRTAGLVGEPLLGKRRNRLFVASIFSAFVLASLAWTSAIAPRKKVDPQVTIREELVDIASQRKERIARLQAGLGDRCEPAVAHELVECLVMDGQTAIARQFGEAYIARCGEDTVVHNWAHAPRPWTRRRR